MVALVVAATIGSLVGSTGSAGAASRPGSGSASGTGAGADGPTYRESMRAAIADIQDFWAREYRALYGRGYEPIPQARVIAARPGVTIPKCQGFKVSYRDVRGNAFYCLESNFIAYDDVGLMPQFFETFGQFAPSLILAHEWGHAIQDRADVEQLGLPSVYVELQADCFAGAWTGDVAVKPQQVAYAPGDLEGAVAALIELRDAPGSSPDDSDAHGSAFDRLSAFQDGYLLGPERCAAYVDEPPLVVQIPFSSRAEAASGGNLPAEDVIPTTVELLDEFYSRVEPEFRSLTLADVVAFDSTRVRTIPRCGGTRPDVEVVANRVYFCIEDGYLAFDEPFLQSVYDEIGDFGVATLIANPVATSVQIGQRIPGARDNTLEAVMQADCYTGGWVAALYNGFLSGSLSAGDLDEFVQAYLSYSRARGVSGDVPLTFVRVRFFRQGFLEGYGSCDYARIAAQVAAL